MQNFKAFDTYIIVFLKYLPFDPGSMSLYNWKKHLIFGYQVLSLKFKDWAMYKNQD